MISRIGSWLGRMQIYALQADIKRLQSELNADLPYRNQPHWTIGNASEPDVQAGMRDLVRPGDVTYDVGAHEGSLTQILSRLVGPRGMVVDFEANPTTARQLTANNIKNALFNTYIVNRAVFSRRDAFLTLMEDGAATRFVDGATGTIKIPAVVLDQFASAHNMPPNFIKFDIEGGEYDAMLGMTSIMEHNRPRIIYEHNVGDDRPLDLLRSHGYRTFSLADYREIFSSSDVGRGRTQDNVAAIHRDDQIIDLYGSARLELSADLTSQVRKIKSREASASCGHSVVMSGLAPGRYVLSLDLTCEGPDSICARTVQEGLVTGQFWTKPSHFMFNQRDLPFDTNGEDVEFELSEISTRSTLQVTSLKLYAVRRQA